MRFEITLCICLVIIDNCHYISGFPEQLTTDLTSTTDADGLISSISTDGYVTNQSLPPYFSTEQPSNTDKDQSQSHFWNITENPMDNYSTRGTDNVNSVDNTSDQTDPIAYTDLNDDTVVSLKANGDGKEDPELFGAAIFRFAIYLIDR